MDSTNKRYYKVKGIWVGGKVFNTNRITGEDDFHLDEARRQAIETSKMPYSVEAQILDMRRLFFRRVIEVYKRGLMVD